jgi:hypothetical protein
MAQTPGSNAEKAAEEAAQADAGWKTRLHCASKNAISSQQTEKSYLAVLIRLEIN